MLNLNTLKIGDKVRRRAGTGEYAGIKQGDVAEVDSIDVEHRGFTVKGSLCEFAPEFWELVEYHSSYKPEEPMSKADEVFEYLKNPSAGWQHHDEPTPPQLSIDQVYECINELVDAVNKGNDAYDYLYHNYGEQITFVDNTELLTNLDYRTGLGNQLISLHQKLLDKLDKKPKIDPENVKEILAARTAAKSVK